MNWAIPFTMDRADVDIGRPMKLAFKLRTSANYTALPSFEDVTVQLYDLDNNLVVPLDNLYAQPLPVATTTTGIQFGFTPNRLGYNCVFIVDIANINSNAFDLDFIDLEISSAAGQMPGGFITRTVLSDTLRPTVTAGTLSMGANVYNRVFTSRVGDMGFMRVEAAWNAGGANGGNTGVNASYLYNLPAPGGQQWQFDPARVQFNQTATTNGAGNWDGKGAIFAGDMNDNQSQARVSIIPWDATRYRLGLVWTGNNTNTNRGIHGPDLFNLASQFLVNFQAMLPILGFDAGPTYSTQEIALKNTPVSNTPTAATPSASGVWALLTNNSVVLPPGMHDITGYVDFNNNGSTPTYGQFGTQWGAANGANAAAVPAALSTLPGVTVFGNPNVVNWPTYTGISYSPVEAQSITIKNTQTITLFLNAYQTCSTPANARISSWIVANKRPDYSAFGVYGQVEIRSFTTGVINVQAVWVSPAATTMILPVGTWRVRVIPFFGNSTANTNCAWSLASAPVSGGNLGASYLALANIASIAPYPGTWAGGVFNSTNYGGHPYEVVFRVTAGTATLYGCVFQQSSANANNQVTLNMTAERLQ